MNALDIIIVIIFIGYIINGFFSGIFESISYILKFILTIFLFKALNPIVSKYLIKTKFFIHIKSKILENLDYNNILENLANSKVSLPFSSSKLAENISNVVSNIFIGLVTLAIILIIMLVILPIFKRFFNILFKLPILNSINKIGGALIGTLNGVLTLWVLGLLIFISNFLPNIDWLKNISESSKFLHLIIQNNYLIKILTLFINKYL